MMRTRNRRPETDAFPYADAAKLLRETFDALLPPRRINTAEHAAQHRYVKSPVGSHLERWDHDTAPYLTQPMEVVDSGEHDTAVIVGPGACGKTMVAENWLLKSIEADPAELLWYMQSDPARDAYVKGRIEPMLEAHDKLIGSLRHGRDSVEFKRFRGMRAEFLSFHHNNLVNKHVARIVLDEVDAYSTNDWLELANPRRQAAGADSMLLAISHPDKGLPLSAPRERQAGIMLPYADSDRRMWWWPCPQCGGFSSPNPGSGRRMVISYDPQAPLDEIEGQAHLLCPHCDGKISNLHRNEMNRAGKWVGLGQEIDDDGRISGRLVHRNIAGWWIMGAMSPFTQGGIGGMARARVAAERALAVSGDDSTLRTVTVKMWGEPYQAPREMGAVDAQALAERAVPAEVLKQGYVPSWVRVITMSADAQRNRHEVVARGWGPGMESCIIDHQVLPGEPATNPEHWDALLRMLATKAYPLADGSGRAMRVRAATFDSFGSAGVTEQAYAAWLRAKRAGLARMAGKVRGREAWYLVPYKGASGANAPRLTLSYPDSARKDRRAAAKGEIPLLLANPNLFKDELAAQLGRGEPGQGYVHIPRWRVGDPAPYPWLEQLTAETRDRRGAWAKEKESDPNEATDLMVMASAVARLHGIHRIDWAAPPAWAAEWDQNSMVVPWNAPSDGAEAPLDRVTPAQVVAAAAVRRRPVLRRMGPASMMG
jgi:phage terminase large subunit GpA-like protein